MGWDESVVPDPNDPETFERSKLDWAELEHGDHARLLELYRRLAQLRRERPELTDPRRSTVGATAAEAIGGRVYELERGDARVLVNLSEVPWEVTMRRGETVWLSTSAALAEEDERLVLPPDSAVIAGLRD